MLDKEKLEIVIQSWKQQYGQEYRGRTGTVYMVVPGGTAGRREMLRYLIDTLVTSYGYKEEDFSTILKNTIETACVWEEWDDAKRLREWRKRSRDDIMLVLAEVFPKQFDKNERVEDTSKRYIPKENTYVPDSQPSYYEDNTIYEPVVTGRPPLDLSKIPKVERDGLMITNEELLAELLGGNNE